MNELISLVVPIYNVEKYLDKCIKSLIDQTYNNIEIILVNDGSTDNSIEICEKWRKLDSRIIIINKENGGLSDARNFGINVANGRYLCFIDSDDFVGKDMIKKLYESIKKYKADISICNRYHIFDNGNKFIKFKQNEDDLVMTNEEAIFQMNNFEYFDMSVCTKMFKKELFDDLKFPKGKISEDFYVMYKLLDKSTVIIYISEPLYYYYQRSGSISKNREINYDFIKAAYEQCQYVEKKYPNLKNCVRSAYVSANMTSYNMVIAQKGKIPKNVINKLKSEVKENYEFVKNNKDLGKMKKFQTFLFVHSIFVYNLLYKLFKLNESKRYLKY